MECGHATSTSLQLTPSTPQVDALRPLKTKAASLELLEKELASKDSLIASLQRQVSASSRSSPGQHSRGSSHAAQHGAGAHRTSMEVITLQAEVSQQRMCFIVRYSLHFMGSAH